MPIFLIPIAAGAYMYYEMRKKELKEQENSGESCNETTMASPSSEILQSPSNDCADEVIETQLSRLESKKENICISQQVEIRYDDKVVPDRQESAEASTNGSVAADTNEEGYSPCTATIKMTFDMDMIKLKRKRLKRSLSSFKKFLREQNQRAPRPQL